MNPAAGDGPRQLRLFFALWPNDALRQALAAATAPAVARVVGRHVPASNFHVTLAFLGAVPGRTFAGLVEIAGPVRRPPIELAFNRLECWARPKVLVAMPADVPAPGIELVDDLWARLETLGFVRDARPWRPHLTLVRRIRECPPVGLELSPLAASNDGSARWRLALVESVTHPEGPRYRPLAEWPLDK